MKIQRFECNIKNIFFETLFRCFAFCLLSFYFISFVNIFTEGIKISSFTKNPICIFLFIVIFGLYFIIYSAITNYNILITSTSLSFYPSFNFLNKNKVYQIKNIVEVQIRKDTESCILQENTNTNFFVSYLYDFLDFILATLISYEYKWIKIKLKSGKEYKYFCFGLEYDYLESDNNYTIDDLFGTLKNKNIKVIWI